MNRLEQIVKASKANIKKREDEIQQVYDRYAGFIEGAEWADNTMIDKACEWLKNNLPAAMVRSDYYMFNGEFIKDFKKAMEGDEQ